MLERSTLLTVAGYFQKDSFWSYEMGLYKLREKEVAGFLIRGKANYKPAFYILMK